MIPELTAFGVLLGLFGYVATGMRQTRYMRPDSQRMPLGDCVDGVNSTSPVVRLMWTRRGDHGVPISAWEHADGTWHMQHGEPSCVTRHEL